MTGEGGLIEVQATAERTPLSRAHLDELLALAARGHRAAARRSAGGRRGRRLIADGRAPCELAARHPQRAQARASSRRLLEDGTIAGDPLPADVTLPPEEGETLLRRTRSARLAPRRRRRAG
jgi:IS5 family transposase